MITLLKPIILTFAKSDSVKRLVIDILKKLVATTDNQLDDQAVEFIETKIFVSSKQFLFNTYGKMNKANEEQFNELHNLVTTEFLNRVRNGEATTQDLKAACDWLKANDISGVAYDGNPLDKLSNLIPKVDPELVARRMYGKR